ncbi:alpha/beta hydrolase [Lentisphaera profundi]|uniref:Alpha/beta hydrolase n=1 Tax=Lentisphaera profundi TaxID=1658616 RepID=A0ABY7VWS0_9BACT|nr:alpha/beta hydrolase [Lentisphaera profundi]WDE98673.1 alpha/beta hydrolase [Lentisphaera profundi]
MTRLFLIFFLSVFLPLVSPAQNKKTPPVPNHIHKLTNLAYGTENNPRQSLDLYLPKKFNSPVPVIMWIHGGGWKNGSKDRLKGLWLIEHGYAIASINYRLIPDHQWPAQIDDCRSAVRFLRKNALKYNLNPNQIIAWGDSAGGHLAALLGTQFTPTKESVSSRVQAVIDWYGPTDLLTMPPNVVSEKRSLEKVSQSNGAKLLGQTVRDVPHLAKEASAFWNVSKDDPPFLIMHGDKDPAVPIEQSLRLHEKQKQAGAPSQLFIVKNAGHGGKLFMSPEANQVILDFLEKNFR